MVRQPTYSLTKKSDSVMAGRVKPISIDFYILADNGCVFLIDVHHHLVTFGVSKFCFPG